MKLLNRNTLVFQHKYVAKQQVENQSHTAEKSVTHYTSFYLRNPTWENQHSTDFIIIWPTEKYRILYSNGTCNSAPLENRPTETPICSAFVSLPSYGCCMDLYGSLHRPFTQAADTDFGSLEFN